MAEKRESEVLGKPDFGLYAIVALLAGFGVLMVFDASYGKTADAKWANFDTLYMLRRQFIYLCVGLFLMVVTSKIKLKTLQKISTSLIIGIILLLVGLFVFGAEVNGAKRWYKVGPVSFQPSEFAKIVIVLYLASILASKRINIRRMSERWLIPILIVGFVSGLICIQPDMGTALIIVGSSFFMLYGAGARKVHLLLMSFVGIVLGAIALFLEPYRMDRVWVWLNPWVDQYDKGYTIIHSLMALGTGGIFGVGLCEGREKFYIPAASTDFIFATVGEELGLIGGIILMAAFIIFTYKGFDIAGRAKSDYGKLVAIGITSVISLQALVNIAVVSSLIPATGVPLPFISYGGSSLISILVGVGILQAISRQINTT